jgi:hypothetical protein
MRIKIKHKMPFKIFSIAADFYINNWHVKGTKKTSTPPPPHPVCLGVYLLSRHWARTVYLSLREGKGAD